MRNLSDEIKCVMWGLKRNRKLVKRERKKLIGKRKQEKERQI